MQSTNTVSSPQQKLPATLSQKPLKRLLEQRMDTIRILDPVLRLGFAQVPVMVLRDIRLSIGARLIYGVLLSYAWQKASCFAGQSQLAKDLGISTRQAQRYIEELKAVRWLDVSRKNKRLNNVYTLRVKPARKSS